MNDADDLALVVAHRDAQHRLRPVIVLLVEGGVEAILGGFGDIVGVVEADDLTADRAVAGDRTARERQHRADVRTGVLRAGLRDREAQLLFAVVAVLEQEETPRVGLRELACAAHDHLVQLGDVALGGERDADAEEAVGFLFHPASDVVEIANLGALGEQTFDRTHGCHERRRIDRPHQPAADVRIAREPRHRGVAGVADHDRRRGRARFNQAQSLTHDPFRTQRGEPLGFDEVRDAHRIVRFFVREGSGAVRDRGAVEGSRQRSVQQQIVRVNEHERGIERDGHRCGSHRS